MQLARRRLKAPLGGESVRLYPLGDTHIGAAACDLSHFRRIVQRIKADPFARWIGMGDLGDLIMPSDPRWAMAAHDWHNLGYLNGRPSVSNLAVEHRDMLLRELAPIADKCDGIHMGNHEAMFTKHYFVDVARFLAGEFEVPYLDYTALTRYEIEIPRGSRAHHELWAPIIFSEHGASGGGTDGNALNALQKRAAEFSADVYLKGHVHKFNVSQKAELAWGREGLVARDRVFMLTGTYLKGYTQHETQYGEYKGYSPNQIGGGVVIFEPSTRRIHAVSVDALAAVV